MRRAPTSAPLASPSVPEFRAPSAPATSCRPTAPAGGRSSTSSPVWSSRPATARSSRRCSRTSGCSCGSARPPTSSPRRCTTSRTRAAGASPCAPSTRLGLCGPSSSTSPAAPWKVWYAGPNFRYESPAGGPLPPARPGRRRGPRHRRPRRRRRGHRPGSAASTERLGLRQRARCSLNSLGDAGDRGRYADALTRLPSSATPPTLSRAEPSRRWRATRCGCSTPSGRQDAAGGRPRRPGVLDYLVPTSGRALRAGPGRPQASLGIPFALEPRLVRGLDYYTPHHRSSSPPTRSTRPRTPSAAAVATTAWSRTSAARPTAGHRLRARGRPHPAGLRRRGRVRRRPTSAVDVFVVDTTGGAARRWRSPPSCGRPASPPTGPSTTAA